MSPVIRRCLQVALLAAYAPVMGCSASDSDSTAGRRPHTPTLSRSVAATAVCDSVAVRWRLANIAFTQSDSVARTNSVIDSATVCVVTAVAEDDPGAKLLPFSYWTDSTKQGWHGISRWDADGPDGTSRTLFRAGVRCQVDGEWDGGDDSNPTGARSKRMVERTTCWGDTKGLTPRDTSTMP